MRYLLNLQMLKIDDDGRDDDNDETANDSSHGAEESPTWTKNYKMISISFIYVQICRIEQLFIDGYET